MKYRRSDPSYITSQTETLSFSGRITELRNRTRDVWIQITHKHSEPSEIQCHLLFPHPWNRSHIIPDLQDGNLAISVDSPHKGLLYLKMIGGGIYGSTEVTFTINSYEFIPSNSMLPEGSKIRAIIDLTRCRLIKASHHMPFGWQVHDQEEDGTAISWSTGNASYKFVALNASQQVLVGQDRGRLTIWRPCLIEAFVTNRETDLATILDQIETESNESLRLFSFLSREWVDWFNISVSAEWPQEDGRGFSQCTRRAEIWELHPTDNREDPLLDESDLSDGEFLRLLSNLRSLPYSQDLKRAMAYSLSSRHGPGDESDFLLAFAALETLINILDKKSPLLRIEDIGWNALSKSLKKAIDEHGRSKELSGEQLLLIKGKISELQRPPIFEKMTFHLKRLAVETEDLWQDPVTLEDQFITGLREAINQRNLLVHATSVDDFGSLRRDLARIQLLFERLVLRILGHTRSVSSRALSTVHWQEERLRRGEK